MQKYIEFKLSILDILSKTYPYIKTTFEEFKFSWRKFTVATVVSTIILGSLTPSYITYAENEDIQLMECLKAAIISAQDVDGIPIKTNESILEVASCSANIGSEKFEQIQKGTKALRRLLSLLKMQEMKITKEVEENGTIKNVDIYIDADDVWAAINMDVIDCVIYEDGDMSRCLVVEPQSELFSPDINDVNGTGADVEIRRSDICKAATKNWNDDYNYFNIELLLQCYMPDANKWSILGNDLIQQIDELNKSPQKAEVEKRIEKLKKEIVGLEKSNPTSAIEKKQILMKLEDSLFKDNAELDKLLYLKGELETEYGDTNEIVNTRLQVDGINQIKGATLKNSKYFVALARELRNEIYKQAGIINYTIGASTTKYWTKDLLNNWNNDKSNKVSKYLTKYGNSYSVVTGIIDNLMNKHDNTSSVISNLYTPESNIDYDYLTKIQKSAQFVGDSLKRIIINSLISSEILIDNDVLGSDIEDIKTKKLGFSREYFSVYKKDHMKELPGIGSFFYLDDFGSITAKNRMKNLLEQSQVSSIPETKEKMYINKFNQDFSPKTSWYFMWEKNIDTLFIDNSPAAKASTNSGSFKFNTRTNANKEETGVNKKSFMLNEYNKLHDIAKINEINGAHLSELRKNFLNSNHNNKEEAAEKISKLKRENVLNAIQFMVSKKYGKWTESTLKNVAYSLFPYYIKEVKKTSHQTETEFYIDMEQILKDTSEIFCTGFYDKFSNVNPKGKIINGADSCTDNDKSKKEILSLGKKIYTAIKLKYDISEKTGETVNISSLISNNEIKKLAKKYIRQFDTFDEKIIYLSGFINEWIQSDDGDLDHKPGEIFQQNLLNFLNVSSSAIDLYYSDGYFDATFQDELEFINVNNERPGALADLNIDKINLEPLTSDYFEKLKEKKYSNDDLRFNIRDDIAVKIYMTANSFLTSKTGESHMWSFNDSNGYIGYNGLISSIRELKKISINTIQLINSDYTILWSSSFLPVGMETNPFSGDSVAKTGSIHGDNIVNAISLWNLDIMDTTMNIACSFLMIDIFIDCNAENGVGIQLRADKIKDQMPKIYEAIDILAKEVKKIGNGILKLEDTEEALINFRINTVNAVIKAQQIFIAVSELASMVQALAAYTKNLNTIISVVGIILDIVMIILSIFSFGTTGAITLAKNTAKITKNAIRATRLALRSWRDARRIIKIVWKNGVRQIKRILPDSKKVLEAMKAGFDTGKDIVSIVPNTMKSFMTPLMRSRRYFHRGSMKNLLKVLGRDVSMFRGPNSGKLLYKESKGILKFWKTNTEQLRKFTKNKRGISKYMSENKGNFEALKDLTDDAIKGMNNKELFDILKTTTKSRKTKNLVKALKESSKRWAKMDKRISYSLWNLPKKTINAVKSIPKIVGKTFTTTKNVVKTSAKFIWKMKFMLGAQDLVRNGEERIAFILGDDEFEGMNNELMYDECMEFPIKDRDNFDYADAIEESEWQSIDKIFGDGFSKEFNHMTASITDANIFSLPTLLMNIAYLSTAVNAYQSDITEIKGIKINSATIRKIKYALLYNFNNVFHGLDNIGCANKQDKLAPPKTIDNINISGITYFDGGVKDLNNNNQLSITGIIQKGIRLFLLFIAGISIIGIIYGGFRYTQTQGDDSEIEKARKIITYSIIGLVITFIAYFIVAVISSIIFSL